MDETLDKIYTDLKRLRDEIALKQHLASMDLRDQWKELEADWSTWNEQVAEMLEAKVDDLELCIRKAGGDDLRKVELKTKALSGKLQRGFKDLARLMPSDDT